MSKRVVIIEDEPDIREIISYNLKKEGFEVIEADSGEKGLALIKQQLPDIAILDIMLPGADGLEICRELKLDPGTRNLPIIMVSAKGEESDIVLGLGLGADDYVSKPFSPKELISRIKAVLRRGPVKEHRTSPERISVKGLSIDPQRHEVVINGKGLAFTATEFRLLHALASSSGIVFTRDRLISLAMGEDAFITERNIDVHIRSLRKKLGDLGELVETVRGVGYRFASDTD